jgi:putative transposase
MTAPFMKILYLATMEVAKKWTGRMKDLSIMLSQLNIYFKERIESYVV